MNSGEIRALVSCVITAAVSVLFVIVLDSVTGVSFNYAVPIALIAALIPFAVLSRRQSTQRNDRSHEVTDQRTRAGRGRFAQPLARPTRHTGIQDRKSVV